MGAILFVPLFLSLFWLVLSLRRCNKRKQDENETKLPPGSMGWPFIGETLRLYSQDPNVFFSTRHKRLFFRSCYVHVLNKLWHGMHQLINIYVDVHENQVWRNLQDTHFRLP